MKAKIILILVCLLFILGFRYVYAEVMISEVKYSPTTKQWIEIKNNTNEDIDITSYKILDSGATTNGHSIVVLDGGTNIISANGFGIIAKAPEDFSGAQFPIFKSSLNIKVSEDRVVLKNNSGTEESFVVVDGSATDGNSLQLTSDGSWKACEPTPGSATSSSCGVLSSGGSSSSSSSLNFNNENEEEKVKPKVIEVPTIKAKIITNNLAFANQSTDFSANLLGYSNEKLVLGKLFWNFGDGASLEQINKFEKVSHTYYYPGEYIVKLEYYSSSLDKDPVAIDKIVVKVVPLTVSISKVGDVKDFFIELTNNSNYDVDISKWILSAGGKKFIIPKNTMILPKKQITISNKITSFSLGDSWDLKLFMNDGSLVYDYTKPVYVNNFTNNKNSIISTTDSNEGKTDNLEINTDLSGLALNTPNGDSNQNRLLKYSTFFAIFLIFSGLAIYFIRRNKNSLDNNNDFEILDE